MNMDSLNMLLILGFLGYINRKQTLFASQQLENKSAGSTMSTLREIDDRCTVGSHFLHFQQGKVLRDAGQKKLCIKLAKRVMHVLESFWTSSFTNRGLPPKWFLAIAENDKKLHG